jgi:hypothetical protein
MPRKPRLVGGVPACRQALNRDGTGQGGRGTIRMKFPLLASPSPLRAREAPPCGRRASLFQKSLLSSLGAKIFLNGGVKGFGYFFLEIVTVEQAFILLVGQESHLHQNRGDVRGFQNDEISLPIGRVF